LEHTPRQPDYTVVLADLNTELHRLPLVIPTGVLGKREEHDGNDPNSLSANVLYTFGGGIAIRATEHPSFRAAVAVSFGVELGKGTSRRMTRCLLSATS
jgi:hypothetical protein